MSVYGRVFRRVLFPAWEGGLRGRPTLRYLAHLERTQWRSLDELLAMQLGALRRLLTHAHSHVPYYRARLDEAGLRPSDLRTIDDVRRLPLLTRADARAAGEARRSTAPPLPTVEKSTSGTLGQPLSFAYDAGSEHWRQAMKWRGYGWAGYHPGDVSLHFWGVAAGKNPSRFQRAKIAADRWLRREVYVNCTRRGEAELRAAVEMIRRVRPAALLCYAQAGADLARFINERGLRDWGNIAVLCGAERLFAADRLALEAAFGPSVFETYGCRETMLIASECEAHGGLHVSAENLLVEVVVPEENRAARPGETGDVVLTDLHNYGMPFIRYANGDRAVAGDAGRCACGRELPRLASVEGRVAETLRDGAGGRVSGLVFNVMFASVLAQSVRQFQVVQHKDDSITLKLVPTGALDERTQATIRQTCGQYLKGLPVKTQVVDEIPLTKAGKRQVVVVET